MADNWNNREQGEGSSKSAARKPNYSDHHNNDDRNLDSRIIGDMIGSNAMLPIFLGNLLSTYSADAITEVFERPIQPTEKTTYNPIPVDRIDIKRGYCFVFLKDALSQADRDNVEGFVMNINGMEIPNVSQSLRAEFARGDGRVKKKEDERRRNIQPSETLFVVNFHEETTRQEDLQMLFEPFGELVRIDMKRNYAFVQFRTIAEATFAKERTNGGKLDQSVLTVEYVARQRRALGRDDGRPRDDRPRRDDRRNDRYDSRGDGGWGRDNRNNDRYDSRDTGRGTARYDDQRYDDRRGHYDDRRGDRRSRSRSRSPIGGGGGAGRYRGGSNFDRRHSADRNDDFRGGGARNEDFRGGGAGGGGREVYGARDRSPPPVRGASPPRRDIDRARDRLPPPNDRGYRY